MQPTEQIIRAWRDSVYRAQLTEDERRDLPPSPVGVPEVDELPDD